MSIHVCFLQIEWSSFLFELFLFSVGTELDLDPDHGCWSNNRNHEQRGTPIRLCCGHTMKHQDTCNDEEKELTQYSSSLYMKGVMALLYPNFCDYPSSLWSCLCPGVSYYLQNPPCNPSDICRTLHDALAHCRDSFDLFRSLILRLFSSHSQLFSYLPYNLLGHP